MALAALALIGCTFKLPDIQTWDREVAPGVAFRMEVQKNPPLTVYGLRWNPRRVRAESILAGGTIYEPGAENGRGVVSALVRDHKAQAGFNGDFFQWSPDPGGDPTGFMVHQGSLISAPGKGGRANSAAWRPNGLFEFLRPKIRTTVSTGLGEFTPDVLNGKTAKGQLGLSFEVAGSVYGEEPITAAVIRLAGKPPKLAGQVQGVVEGVVAKADRMAIAKDRAVLSGLGDWAGKLSQLKKGDKVTIQIESSGLPDRATEGIGGGPRLLNQGAYAGPKEDDAAPRHPRTVIGTTASGENWAIVIDGRQPMSGGVTFTEASEIMRRWGCVDGLNLDGGGSSTLHALGLSLNRPSGGVERSVANAVALHWKTRPPKGGDDIQIIAPQSLAMAGSGKVLVARKGRELPLDKVIFTCQGAAWIDQDGTLTTVKAGEAKIGVLVDGQAFEKTIQVVGP